MERMGNNMHKDYQEILKMYNNFNDKKWKKVGWSYERLSGDRIFNQNNY